MSANQTYNEEELVVHFHKGDERAFTELYNLYFSQIYVYARKIVDNSEEAKDITISTFGKLFAKHKDFDNLPEIRGFLYTSVRNASLNYLKQLHRRNSHQQPLSELASTNDELSKDQIEGEMLAAIFKALKDLPPECRKVLELLYLDGKKYAEVGVILNISVETVKSQRKYGIKKLRDKLGTYPLIIALLYHWF